MNLFKTLSMPSLRSIVIALMVSATQLPTVTLAANDVAQISFQDALQQERQWAGLQTKTRTVGDIVWHYSEGGPTNAPTVLLVHGLSGTRDNWNRVARELTAKYHVIAPDLPLHGDTQTAANYDASVPNLAEKLRRFAEALGIENNLNIAGHSMGGAIATLYNAQYSSSIKSLMLMDAAGVFRTANTSYLKDPTRLNEFVVRKSGDFNRMMQLVMSRPPYIPQQLLAQQERFMIAKANDTQHVIEQLIQIQKNMTPESFEIATKVIDNPALIMWGDQDKIINVEVAQELKGMIKNAQPPIIYKGVGHMPLMEVDQLAARDYLQFLNQVNKR